LQLDRLQSSTKAPSAHEPLGNVRGNKYICVFPMNLDKSNLVQYCFTLGTSCRQPKNKNLLPSFLNMTAFVVGHNCLQGLLVKD
jgi:hypothetical protein